MAFCNCTLACRNLEIFEKKAIHQFDFGDRKIIHHSKTDIHFELNGKEHKINLGV